MKKNEILVIYGTEYLELTKKLLEEAQLAEMIGDSGKIIGIKPNLVAPVPAEDGGTTHPEVVEGLLQYLQEHGFRNLRIMEGSWVGDRTEESFQVCGYDRLAEQYGVELIDAQKEPAVSKDCGGMELHLCRCATEVELYTCTTAFGAPSTASKVLRIMCSLACVRTCTVTSSGISFRSIKVRRKLYSVSDAAGNPTSISLNPIFTSILKNSTFSSRLIGSMSA